jgi:hypothetical protein
LTKSLARDDDETLRWPDPFLVVVGNDLSEMDVKMIKIMVSHADYKYNDGRNDVDAGWVRPAAALDGITVLGAMDWEVVKW